MLLDDQQWRAIAVPRHVTPDIVTSPLNANPIRWAIETLYNIKKMVSTLRTTDTISSSKTVTLLNCYDNVCFFDLNVMKEIINQAWSNNSITFSRCEWESLYRHKKGVML